MSFISKKLIDELRSVGPRGLIANPEILIYVGEISKKLAELIGSSEKEVFISRRALKHIVDNREIEAEIVIDMIPLVLDNPNKVADNSKKRINSYLFIRKTSKYYGVVIEITKTTGLSNQVVSAFIINYKTYEKIHDISGGTASPWV